MALDNGDAATGTGLAGAIFSEMNTRFGPFEERALGGVYEFCNAMGEAIVTYVKDNAELDGTDSMAGSISGGII